MRQPPVRKQKIELSDYNYQRDITNRLLMAQLTTFEVDVLREVLNGSLKFHLSDLAEALSVDQELVVPVLSKLSQTGLLSVKADMVVVDKEMRKYYEAQIEKFEDDFEPGMEFIQSLLSKVPIHHLPSWYAISRISDHIFQSIVEKYFHTAKGYERYLQELEFDDPVLRKIMNDVYNCPSHKVPARDLIGKHGLTHEEFERKMLLLEYSFACCIVYQRVGDCWEEVVTPFHEWREYLGFIQRTTPQSITEVDAIERQHVSDFGFVEDLAAILRALPVEVDAVEVADENQNVVSYTLSPKTWERILPHAHHTPLAPAYHQRLAAKSLMLQLVDVAKKRLHLTEKGAQWLKQCTQDQAHSVYCLPSMFEGCTARFGDRDIREVAKSLKRVAKAGWIDFESFMAGLLEQIGKAAPVTLKNKGKRWWYELPSYSTEEKDFVKALICDKFFDAGMVATGMHEGKLCFCVTPFGRMLLEN